MPNTKQPHIGFLADLHYDGSAEAMDRLYEAACLLNESGAERLMVMGDLINGSGEQNSRRLLREVAALCDAFHGPIRYMPGNHDLDHLSKPEFYNALGYAGDPARFQFDCGGYTFICIDCNYNPDGTEYNRGNFSWQECAMPLEELEWLQVKLGAALLPVIVVSHQRIDKECIHAARNHAAIRKVIRQSGKVQAVFQGHNHEDDLIVHDGTPYYTLAAHTDGAGPAVIQLGAKGVRLVRDFQEETEICS